MSKPFWFFAGMFWAMVACTPQPHAANYVRGVCPLYAKCNSQGVVVHRTKEYRKMLRHFNRLNRIR